MKSSNNIHKKEYVITKAEYDKLTEVYNKCQEDNKDKKYTFNQIVDAIQMARETDGKETYYKYSMEQILESLNN